MKRREKFFCVAISIIAIGCGITLLQIRDWVQDFGFLSCAAVWLLIGGGVLVLLRSLTIPTKEVE